MPKAVDGNTRPDRCDESLNEVRDDHSEDNPTGDANPRPDEYSHILQDDGNFRKRERDIVEENTAPKGLEWEVISCWTNTVTAMD